MGERLSLYSILPFVGMLLCISGLPLLAPKFWHRHYGKISWFWSLAAAVPLIYIYGRPAAAEFLHVFTVDYVPFVILLWALYTVSGGILIRGALSGTPLMNVLVLVTGTCLASLMGTTGAAMLLIRPFLRANSWRKRRSFMVVFFIFLVANIGGALTPLGDPPLFLGFLHGVPFGWTLGLWPEMVTAVGIILAVYIGCDLYFYRQESRPESMSSYETGLRVEGATNFIFLGGIIVAILISGLIDIGETSFVGIRRANSHLVRDFILISMGAGSIVFTARRIREDNEFTWLPMVEVACLFWGIFISMVPCLLILRSGESGALRPLIETIKDPADFFWATGLLSSLLDNAPTYLAFLSTALGRFYPGHAEAHAVQRILSENAVYLKAVSCGAVFMGANTYIGNAPNFMVRSIAEEMGTAMPGFFGYIFKYSIPVLGTTFVIISLTYFP